MEKCHSWKVGAFAILFFIVFLVPSAAAGRAYDDYFQEADFTRVVFIGDSLTAGFQSGGLAMGSQQKGYAALLAQQAGFELTLPLVSEPGIPAQFQLINVEPLIIVRPNEVGKRINPMEQATNLGVPFHKVADALCRRPSASDPITSVVLGEPGASNGFIRSQTEWALALSPTFVFIWIGNNDVLSFATSGGTRPLTPVDLFKQNYQELLRQVESTGAALMIANLPDVTATAYFFSAEEVAGKVGRPLSEIGPLLGIQCGDFVTLEGLPLVEQILTRELSPPLPDEAVLDGVELWEAQQALRSYNRIIARETYRRRIPLVNVNLLLNFLRRFGLSVNGKWLNTQFLGGLFSLDGIHPTNTGYAVLANQFIWNLNFWYRTRLKGIDLSRVAREDPLVIPDLLPDPKYSSNGFPDDH